MIEWMARVDTVTKWSGTDLSTYPDLQIRRDGGSILVGKSHAKPLDIVLVKSIMELVSSVDVGQNAILTWLFSCQAIPVMQLGSLLQRWDETDEPPVLSIITLHIGKDQHITRGLASFAGFEIAATFDVPLRSEEAANNVARLARHVMLCGTLDRTASYVGVDGSVLSLDWTDDDARLCFVTIMLKSNRNGPVSD